MFDDEDEQRESQLVSQIQSDIDEFKMLTERDNESSQNGAALGNTSIGNISLDDVKEDELDELEKMMAE